jgi:hypothetical protein
MMARIFSLLAFGECDARGLLDQHHVGRSRRPHRDVAVLDHRHHGQKTDCGALQVTKEKALAIFASGAIGALTLTFSDSFWFTAVEAEVYVTSLLMTAFVFLGHPEVGGRGP